MFAFSEHAYVSTLLFFWLLWLTVIDFKHMILPNILNYSGLALGLLLAPYHELSYLESFLGAILGFGLFYAIYYTYTKLRGFEGMGFGDVKFLAMIGAWVGALNLPLVLLAASFTGILAFIVRGIFTRKGGDIPMPFGPFLAAGCWFTFLYSEDMWYAIIYAQNTIRGILL